MHRFFNPSMIVLDGQMWVFSRFMIKPNPGPTWKYCPDNSMYASRVCPPSQGHEVLWISTAAICRVDGEFDPNAEVVAIDYDFGYDNFLKLYYALGPEDSRYAE